MKKMTFYFVWLIAVTLIVALTATAAPVSVVSKETVKGWLDNGEVIILDARQGRDWKSSEFKIKGAHRADPGKLDTWKTKFAKDKKIVIYCS